ncbi:hypothetical protein LTR35_013217 [Friedmanniomyces endolithicus]|uniref:Uncharacterized protein n=1 Tax=Friedmanniomyces endolithicus TaxID=329885 RepID=A0AAN6FF30_9PEZI|nr:hypothetical protein LTS00_016586 [Friedmanniomyces endolithicus]KAK0271741.1 hypothetical protein LTR35_013217 [Friedmanniomyces endolithicus]KAK0315210.1 hypothetical protein LTR82_012537 [Friedmanniomyces endolithicus]KAK0988230.1 hypothetical protein LTR54_012938 [Friedmanniomyces endolithicus]
MDEQTFQRELHQLKERVAVMTARRLLSSPRGQPSSLTSAGIEFTAQVDDLRQHIARLEQVLGEPYQPVPLNLQPHTMPWDLLPLTKAALVPQSSNPPRPELHYSLPKSFNDLRCDVDDVNARCRDVEGAVAELEDKMDRLDPYRFTPLGSEASTDDGVGLHPVLGSSMLLPPPAPPGLYPAFGANVSLHPPPPPSPHSTHVQETRGTEFRESSATSSATVNEHLLTTKQVAEGLFRAKLDASHITLDILRKLSARMDDAQPLPKPEQKVVHAIVKFHRKLAADHSWSAASLQDSSRAGVAFRDQEILRLEELLSEAQEAAMISEQQACQARKASSDLHKRYQECAGMNYYHSTLYHKRDAEVYTLKEEASQREVHLQQLNDYLHTRDEQIERCSESYRQVLERSKAEGAIIQVAECRIEKLRQMLLDCQRNKDNDIDRMVQGREEEIGRLQQFCEQKDVVAHSQEQIIARGASLMEQKDETIEALSRKVEALQEDNASERKQRQLTSKLLEERDTELIALKASSTRPSAVPTASSHSDRRPHTPDRVSARSPFLASPPRPQGAAWMSVHPERRAYILEGGIADTIESPTRLHEQATAKHDDAPPLFAKRPTVWSPRPIPHDRRLPHEVNRASAWGRAHEHQSQPSFGKPSPMGHRRHQDESPRRRRSSPHPRKIRYLIDGEVVDAEDDGRSKTIRHSNERAELPNSPAAAAERHASFRRSTSGRHSLPMDRTVWPPLPAPVAPNKMQSLADLRTAVRGEQLQRMGRPKSMQELKKRGEHQAYVETEVESGGEHGGHAWHYEAS